MPLYSYLGLVMLVISEAGMFAHIEPLWSWHTPIAWTGYILFVDGIIYKKRGSSWLMNHRPEFAFLWLVSFPLWAIFEGYNLLIRNWHYVNLPESAIARYGGYAWAFATISPAIFESAELVAVLRRAPSKRPCHFAINRSVEWLLIAAGAVMLTWPLLQPSPYHGALVFVGFIFLLDPLNRRLGAESIVGDLNSAEPERRQRVVNLLIAGFICGLLWEFWNYWARAKWIYDVPIMQGWKLFEMPLAGYLGFPPFAVECFTMYVFVRRLVWRGRARPIGL